MAVDGKYESFADDGTLDGYIEYVNNRSVLTSDYADSRIPAPKGFLMRASWITWCENSCSGCKKCRVFHIFYPAKKGVSQCRNKS